MIDPTIDHPGGRRWALAGVLDVQKHASAAVLRPALPTGRSLAGSAGFACHKSKATMRFMNERE